MKDDKTSVAEVMIDMVTIRPGRTGGAERYVTELFPRLDADPRLRVRYAIQPAARSLMRSMNVPDERLLTVDPIISGPLGLLYSKRQVRRIARHLRFDVVFSPFNQPVLAPGIPEVLTVHDLSPIFYLEHSREMDTSRIKRSELRLRLRRSLAGISKVEMTVVPSASVKAAILSVLPVPNDRIYVAHLGGDTDVVRSSDHWNESAMSTRKVLVVTSGAPHKNLQLLRTVAEDQRTQQEGVTFAVVGRAGLDEVQSGHRWPPSVEFLGSVSEEGLAELMRTSACLFAPSRFEGFGLPLAEAMHIGLPVLASEIAPHREIGGEAAEYFDPLDSGKAATRLISLLKTPALARASSARLLQRASSFTWLACAEAYGDVLIQVARQGSARS